MIDNITSTERLTTEDAALREWGTRLEKARRATRAARPWRPLEASDETSLEDWHPQALHKKLPKVKSSLLIQARTGAIGLGAFLFARRVPTQITPWCSCGEGRETVTHLVVSCPDLAEQRQELPLAIRDGRELRSRLANKKEAPKIISWLLGLGRLREYRLAVDLLNSETSEKWAKGVTAEDEIDSDEEATRKEREMPAWRRVLQKRKKERRRF